MSLSVLRGENAASALQGSVYGIVNPRYLCYETHHHCQLGSDWSAYSDVTRASWPLKSSTIRLFVQLMFQTIQRKNQSSALLGFCAGPMDTFPRGPLMWKAFPSLIKLVDSVTNLCTEVCDSVFVNSSKMLYLTTWWGGRIKGGLNSGERFAYIDKTLPIFSLPIMLVIFEKSQVHLVTMTGWS